MPYEKSNKEIQESKVKGFKMKGSPMKRNFGIGADSNEELELKNKIAKVNVTNIFLYIVFINFSNYIIYLTYLTQI